MATSCHSLYHKKIMNNDAVDPLSVVFFYIQRLQFPDLLVRPIQRLTRYPLLLKTATNCTRNDSENLALNSMVSYTQAETLYSCLRRWQKTKNKNKLCNGLLCLTGECVGQFCDDRQFIVGGLWPTTTTDRYNGQVRTIRYCREYFDHFLVVYGWECWPMISICCCCCCYDRFTFHFSGHI